MSNTPLTKDEEQELTNLLLIQSGYRRNITMAELQRIDELSRKKMMASNTKESQTKEEKRKLLEAFADFQWKNLPVETQLKMVGTVFNFRTIDSFLSTLPSEQGSKQEEGECRHEKLYIPSISKSDTSTKVLIECETCGKRWSAEKYI